MTDARIIRSAPWLAALVAGALCPAGCGGDASTAPSHTYTKIADMEGSGRLIQLTPPPGATAGAWFAATDCSQYERISPPPTELDPDGWSYAPLDPSQETMPGTLSMRATRLRTMPTTPLDKGWGASVGLTFAGPADPDAAVAPDEGVSPGDAACVNPTSFEPDQAVDLTPYAGVTFWARAESPRGMNMRVQVTDVYTDPRGGYCNPTKDTPDYCFNGFGLSVQLTDKWLRYTLDFSQFVQRPGWGFQWPYGIDWSQVYTMVFQMDLPNCTGAPGAMCAGGAPTLSFDIWIDDIYFVNK